MLVFGQLHPCENIVQFYSLTLKAYPMIQHKTANDKPKYLRLSAQLLNKFLCAIWVQCMISLRTSRSFGRTVRERMYFDENRQADIS
jgi:hypothetical protein